MVGSKMRLLQLRLVDQEKDKRVLLREGLC